MLRCIFLFLVSWLSASAALQRMTWTVDGTERVALVSFPDTKATAASPVLFVFHGHGGTMEHAARTMRFEREWPDAMVVYPQGLPTVTALVDKEGKRSGWQSQAGTNGDRDLKFFDAMLTSLLRDHGADPRRVFVTGHSNGGLFTYLLWAERGDRLAAVAPSAGLITHDLGKLKPKPVLHLAGTNDPLVKFEWQRRMIEYVLKINGGSAFRSDAQGLTTYPSSGGAVTAVYLHSGGHRFPSEAQVTIVRFFQGLGGTR